MYCHIKPICLRLTNLFPATCEYCCWKPGERTEWLRVTAFDPGIRRLSLMIWSRPPLLRMCPVWYRPGKTSLLSPALTGKWHLTTSALTALATPAKQLNKPLILHVRTSGKLYKSAWINSWHCIELLYRFYNVMRFFFLEKSTAFDKHFLATNWQFIILEKRAKK